MHKYDFDLFVIGAGSGGVRASRMASSYGAKVAVVEERYLGGTCVNVGCVPKKLFVYGSHFSEDFHDAAAYGWQVQKPAFHWPTLRDNKTREIERLNGIYQKLLDHAGVTTLTGTARLLDEHRVAVDGEVFTARYILVATGSWPFVPEFPGREHVITSNEAFYLEKFPERATVVGGGYIAVEFAGIFNGLGAATRLLYRGPLFLRGFDEGVREFVADELRNKGIDLQFEEQVAKIEKNVDGSLMVQTIDGKSQETDLVLYATGRRPKTQGMGLEEVGVKLSREGAIVVDDCFCSSVPNIFAIGDVIDRLQLTPVAIAEGMCIASNLFNGTKNEVDYAGVPTAVFCQPNIGTVGLTEEQARDSHQHVKIFESIFKPMKHTLTGGEERTFMKLVVAEKEELVVGVHMVGPDAGEIIQGVGIALKAGATKAQFDATIGIHPTAAEELVTMREAVR